MASRREGKMLCGQIKIPQPNSDNRHVLARCYFVTMQPWEVACKGRRRPLRADNSLSAICHPTKQIDLGSSRFIGDEKHITKIDLVARAAPAKPLSQALVM